MKLFLASTSTRKDLVKKYPPLYVLESFYTLGEWQTQELPKYKMFLLDSGAFSFMNQMKKSGNQQVNFDDYLEKYIEFINKYDIKYFFELDVDVVTGYEKVKQMRKVLESRTQKKCIPVWHKSRGVQEFIKLCQDYDYIAIGASGLNDSKWSKSNPEVLKELLRIAKKYNCKVHGLGFTRKDVQTYGFYSVDSSSWTSSARYGGLQYFNGKNIIKVSTPLGKKGVAYAIRDEFILKEWIKYQKYLERF